MSHFKNVQAFEKLTGICTGYGGSYKPGKQHLQVNALAALSKRTQQAMKSMDLAQSNYDVAISQRKRGYENLRKLNTALVQMLKANGTDPFTLKYALAHKLRITGGYKVRPQPPTAETTTKEGTMGYSTGRSYPQSVQAFSRLVELVEKDPLYAPSEEALTLTGLRSTLAHIEELNKAVTTAEIQLTDARRNRDNLLYKGMESLYATAMAVKQYVRAVFGYNSSQHQELIQLSFINPNL